MTLKKLAGIDSVNKALTAQKILEKLNNFFKS